MLQRIYIVTADIYVLAVLVLRQTVMFLIRHNNCSCIKRSQQSGIIFTQETKFIPLIRDIYFVFQIFFKTFYIERAVRMETCGKVFPQYLHFFSSESNIVILFRYILYHYSSELLCDKINIFFTYKSDIQIQTKYQSSLNSSKKPSTPPSICLPKSSICFEKSFNAFLVILAKILPFSFPISFKSSSE